MKATELRIGNYFEYKKHIIQFAIEDFVEISNNDQFLELFLKPIPITGQWLKDFGFEIIDMESGFGCFYYYKKVFKDQFYLRKSYRGGYYYGINLEKGKEFHDAPTIEYIHQLQNLYFALTGKELIK